MTVPCPCCGTQIERVDPKAIVPFIRLSDLQRRIYEVFAKAPGAAISTDQIAASIYADRPDGGPLEANKVIAVTICKLRPKIAAFGLKIESFPGRGGWRRLMWIAP